MYVELRRYFWVVFATGVCAIVCGCSSSPEKHVQPVSVRSSDEGSLDRRMESFLASFDSLSAQEFVSFFPQRSDLVYQHTRHTAAGDEVSTSRFRAAEIPAALESSGWRRTIGYVRGVDAGES